MKLNKKNILILIIVSIAVVVIYLFVNRKITPKIVNTIPQNKEVNVLESINIFINFDKNIEDKIKKDVSIIINPAVEFESILLANSYKIIPRQDLENNTAYKITVLFKNKEIYTFEFETQLFNTKDVLKYGPTQTENDRKFAEATMENVKKYPWYTSLPITTQEYVIFYDFNNQKFAVTFLSPINDLEKIDSVSSEIEIKLKSIGVSDPKNYYFNLQTQN